MIRQASEWWWASRRRRRRIARATVLLVVSGSVASLIVWVRDTGHKSIAAIQPGKVQFYQEPKQVILGAEALRAAKVTTYVFLRTAVLRDHVEDSYALIAPSLREGMTRDQWATGDNPIIPYPVDLKTVRYRVEYSYASSPPDNLPLVGMTVSMKAKKGTQQPAMDFGIELEAAGRGPHRHWLVSSWAPRGQLGGEPQNLPSGKRAEPPKHGSLSPAYLLVPAALLSAIVLVPVGFGVRGWRRQRRVARDFNRGLDL
jgi:hypothetical protein